MIPLKCWRKIAVKLEFHVQYKMFIKYKSEINKFSDKKRWENTSPKICNKGKYKRNSTRRKKKEHK